MRQSTDAHSDLHFFRTHINCCLRATVSIVEGVILKNDEHGANEPIELCDPYNGSHK